MKANLNAKWIAAAVMTLLGSFAAFGQVSRTLGTLPPGGSVTITFDVTIDANFPPNRASVTNQGSVTGAGFGPILTDDPAVGGAGDPTVTPVTVAPQINCPPSMSTNAYGACPQSVAFNATVTAGMPPPVVTYKIGATPITSPYMFPVGTNTVSVTATNGTLPDAGCAFTVTVAPGPAPVLRIAQVGTNVVLSWPSLFPCYSLQRTPALVPPPTTSVWTVLPGPFTAFGGIIYVTNGIGATNSFYRLKF